MTERPLALLRPRRTVVRLRSVRLADARVTPALRADSVDTDLTERILHGSALSHNTYLYPTQ